MQLIVGCRARGASWAGSETLVIPGNRLTIHVYVRIHRHVRDTRVHIYWFRVGVCIYAAYTGWICHIADGWSRIHFCGRLFGWKFAACKTSRRMRHQSLFRFTIPGNVRATSRTRESDRHHCNGHPVYLNISLRIRRDSTDAHVQDNTTRTGTDTEGLFSGVTCLRTPDLLCRL
jgi:hypothetical protein